MANPSNDYNPLAGLDPNSPDFESELDAIAAAMIASNEKDPHWGHWAESARQLVSGLLASVIEGAPETGHIRAKLGRS